jgi:hypothetical protein
MDFKRMRLRNLVNKDFKFYPSTKKATLEDESEVINRYDSDEERNPSDYEEEGFELKDSENYKNSHEEEERKFCTDEHESLFHTAKKSREASLSLHLSHRNSSCVNFRTTEKKIRKNFERLQGDYIDEELIHLAENLKFNFSSKEEIKDFESDVENFLQNFEKKLDFDNLDSMVFFANLFHFFTNKLASNFELFDSKNFNKFKNEENTADENLNNRTSQLKEETGECQINKVNAITSSLFPITPKKNSHKKLNQENNSNHKNNHNYNFSKDDETSNLLTNQLIKRILTTNEILIFNILKIMSPLLEGAGVGKTNLNKKSPSSQNFDKFLKSEIFFRFIYYLLSILDNLLELQINLHITPSINYEFLPQIIRFLLMISENGNFQNLICFSDSSSNPDNEQEEIDENFENIFLPATIGRIKNIIINLNTLFSLKNFSFTSESLKDLFLVCFNLIKEKSLVNIFLHLTETLCNIINISLLLDSDKNFIEKFLEYLISLFMEFTEFSNLDEDKFYQLDPKIYRSFKNYFGVYKCHNGETISLYTLLILKFFSLIYTSEDGGGNAGTREVFHNHNHNHNDENQEKNYFMKIFEMFILKIFETKRNAVLLIIFCIFEDLIKVKYNIEFSISLVILTNLFLCFGNLITNSDLESNKRKFFINLFQIFIENLLGDFKNMKENFLCLGEGKKDHRGDLNSENSNFKNSEKNNANHPPSTCECFSCIFTQDTIFSQNLFFQCNQCNWKTNLKLQITSPGTQTTQLQEGEDICGFCSMKKYFDVYHGDLFSCESDKEFKLIETNEDIIEEYSKSKKQQLENEKSLNDDIKMKNSHHQVDLFENFLIYQDILYKNSFTFIRSNILNFLKIFNKNFQQSENNFFTLNLDASFKIFLKILISDNKINTPEYRFFTQNLIKIYESGKGRIFNSLPDLFIDESVINYFNFYYFYINFLFAGHWKLIDILINEDLNSPWFIKLKSLKILEKFLIFEGEDKFFQNFQPEMLSLLLGDSSFYVKEYSLEILFKLFKFRKITKNCFINILYENINETSFLIRKRIIKALIGLILEEKESEDREHFKTINFIFLNKIIDNSESVKIKNLIYDFYYQIFSSTGIGRNKNRENLVYDIISVFIEILKENDENLNSGSGSFSFYSQNSTSEILLQNIKNLFSILIEDRKLKENCLVNISDFIFTEYILNFRKIKEEIKVNFSENKDDEKILKRENLSHSEDDDENPSLNYLENLKFLIQALNLIKIISSFNPECITVYFQTLLDFLKTEENNQNNNNNNLQNQQNPLNPLLLSQEIILENKTKQITCEIFGNILTPSETKTNIKSKQILLLEIHLIKIILAKPSNVMISAINCYSKILSRSIVSYEKIRELTLKNFLFLKGQVENLFKLEKLKNTISSSKNEIPPSELKLSQNSQKILLNQINQVPLPILSKALTLLAYITYCSENEGIFEIFNFIIRSGSGNSYINNSFSAQQKICENIFVIYKTFTLIHPNNSIKFRSFEALGFFWIRYPHKISESKEIIKSIFNSISNDEEKLIILRTFINFFEKVNLKIKSEGNLSENYTNFSEEDNVNVTSNENYDFGNLHLFFESFINNFSNFLVNEHNSLIRLQAIHLIKLIVEMGNINLHQILPYIYSSLFDYVDEIRHIASGILEKVVKISKDKFLSFTKENLKMSFQFCKKIYGDQMMINSFVKSKISQDEENIPDQENSSLILSSCFETQNENVFELLFYKIGKSIKDENINNKILTKFIQTFCEIKNLENEVKKSNKSINAIFSEILDKFEYYEFIANLIADFKFSKSSEIKTIFQNLFKDYQTEFLVFQTKLKEFRDSNSQTVDLKLIIIFLSIILKISLLKFLVAKFENFDNFENLINKNFENFIQVLKTGEMENNDNDENSILEKSTPKKRGKKNNAKLNNHLSPVPLFSKEFKNIKFFQFYKSALIYVGKLMKFINFGGKKCEKKKLIEYLKNLKELEKTKISEIRSAGVKYKKKLNKSGDKKAQELMCNLIFEKNFDGKNLPDNDNGKEERSLSKNKVREKPQTKPKLEPRPQPNKLLIKNKNNKRVSLDQLSQEESDEEEEIRKIIQRRKELKSSLTEMKKDNTRVSNFSNEIKRGSVPESSESKKKQKENMPHQNKKRKTHG